MGSKKIKVEEHMIKKFDGSMEKIKEVMLIDSESFRDIDCDAEMLCERMERNKQYELYIYYENDVPVAYLGLLYVCNLHYDGMWVDLIAVREKYRNKGIGKKLLKFAEEKAEKENLGAVTGLVKKENLSSSAMFRGREFGYDETGFILYIKSIEK